MSKIRVGTKHFTQFPDFFNHPVIQKIAANERWTVNMDDDKDGKKPLDLKEYLFSGKEWGARYFGPRSLGTLNLVCTVVPMAESFSYYLNSHDADDFLLLDIESSCPDDVKAELLKMPYIYGEVSMSGKGYHLIFPKPAEYANYPAVLTKRALRHEKGWYEILLHHYAAFTRNMIPASAGTGNFVNFFCGLAKEAVDKTAKARQIKLEIDKEIEADDIEYGEEMFEALANATYNKTLEDFYGDESKWEYGHISYLFWILQKKAIELGVDYDDNTAVRILYTVIQEKHPHRAKHDELRENLPWFLYLSKEVVSKNERVEAESETQSNTQYVSIRNDYRNANLPIAATPSNIECVMNLLMTLKYKKTRDDFKNERVGKYEFCYVTNVYRFLRKWCTTMRVNYSHVEICQLLLYSTYHVFYSATIADDGTLSDPEMDLVRALNCIDKVIKFVDKQKD